MIRFVSSISSMVMPRAATAAGPERRTSGEITPGGDVNDLPLAKKSLGQHWLSDEAALNSIVEAGAVGPDDVVLEIGPGGGTLTRKLTEKAGQVLAIELDKSLAA